MERRFGYSVAWLACALAAAPLVAAAAGMEDVEIRSVPLGRGLAMLVGQGGNIAVSVGPDGAFLIDDQFAPLTPKIRAAVRELGGGEVRFVLNTHWHGDHTGGNENLGAGGAVIIAHHNVRERMSSEQYLALRGVTVPPSPSAALPVVTFAADVVLHLNGHTIAAEHVPHAHTDGDAILHLREANVLHMGDTFFNGMYPFIDLSSGGSLNGVIAAVARGLALADDQTKIVPGHGALAKRSDLAAYAAMLAKLRDAVQAEIDAGRSLEETVARRPTRELDAVWGRGFMKPEQVVRIAYRSLSAQPPGSPQSPDAH